jgi:rubredoxin
MRAYRCPVCDYVYDEAKGAAREGYRPGTKWTDIPDDWCCPDCGVREKVDFEPITNRTNREESQR